MKTRRNTNNKIPLATNIVRVELNPRKYAKTNFDVVQRNNFLYNLATNSDIFDENLEDVVVVYLLNFDDIPEQAKKYITIRSARIFHDRTLGANAFHKFTTEDEKKAYSILLQAESNTGDYSIFDTPEQEYVINRFRGF